MAGEGGRPEDGVPETVLNSLLLCQAEEGGSGCSAVSVSPCSHVRCRGDI